MAKKKFTIYVEEGDFLEAQRVAFELSSFGNKVSVGDYLMSLHRKNGTLINPEIETKEIKSIPEKVNIRQVSLDEVEEKISKSELSIRERYKLANPRQMCPQCKHKNAECICG